LTELQCLLFKNLFTVVNGEGQAGYISTHIINNIQYQSKII